MSTLNAKDATEWLEAEREWTRGASAGEQTWVAIGFQDVNNLVGLLREMDGEIDRLRAENEALNRELNEITEPLRLLESRQRDAAERKLERAREHIEHCLMLCHGIMGLIEVDAIMQSLEAALADTDPAANEHWTPDFLKDADPDVTFKIRPPAASDGGDDE